MARDNEEYEAIKARIEKARQELNATKWWQFDKRQMAADRYKHELLMGAFWEIRNRNAE